MTDFTATTSPAIFETNGSTNTWRVSNVGIQGEVGDLPTQTGNGGAVLGTNGTAASWARSFTSPDGETVVSAYDGGAGLDWDGAGGAYAYADVDGSIGAYMDASNGTATASVRANLDGTVEIVASGAATLNSHALVVDTDARLTDARTPTAHASTHATAGSDPITPASIGAVAASDLPYVAVVPGIVLPTATNATLSQVYLASCIYNAACINASNAVNNYFEWEVMIAAGTYTLRTAWSRNTGNGVATISVDGNALGSTIDMYGTFANNNITDHTGIALTAGRHKIRYTATSKNGSSTGYLIYVHGFSLTRTGA